jgi:hypothetical protein
MNTAEQSAVYAQAIMERDRKIAALEAALRDIEKWCIHAHSTANARHLPDGVRYLV